MATIANLCYPKQNVYNSVNQLQTGYVEAESRSQYTVL